MASKPHLKNFYPKSGSSSNKVQKYGSFSNKIQNSPKILFNFSNKCSKFSKIFINHPKIKFSNFLHISRRSIRSKPCFSTICLPSLVGRSAAGLLGPNLFFLQFAYHIWQAVSKKIMSVRLAFRESKSARAITQQTCDNKNNE